MLEKKQKNILALFAELKKLPTFVSRSRGTEKRE